MEFDNAIYFTQKRTNNPTIFGAFHTNHSVYTSVLLLFALFTIYETLHWLYPYYNNTEYPRSVSLCIEEIYTWLYNSFYYDPLNKSNGTSL
jgi:hypothetical protein